MVLMLIDMDGVVCDFDLAFYDLCAERGYVMHEGAVHHDARCADHRFATDCITDPEHKRLARHHVDTTDWFRYLPVIPGAIAGLNELLAHPDVEDVFLCTKPMEANASCRDSKGAWVERHLGMDWVRRLIITPDKGMVRGEVLLDDAPKSHWFDRAEWTPVIYPTSWNQPGSVFSRKMGVCDAPRWDWTMPINDLVWLAAEHRAVA